MCSHKVQSTMANREKSTTDLDESKECDCITIVGCAYCTRYLNYITKLQKLLKDNEIDFHPLKEISGNEKIVPDTMEQIDLSEFRLKYLVDDYYNEETFQKGSKGIVEFINSYVVRDDNSELLYVCADSSKKIFHYYDEKGLQKDIRCKVLIDSIKEPLIKKATKMYRELLELIYQEEKGLVSSDSDSDEEEEYDSDIEEIIAEELRTLAIDKKRRREMKQYVNEQLSNNVDDKVNQVIAIFLEIKKCLGNVRKPVVDELVSLLAI